MTKQRTHNREAQGHDPGPDFVASQDLKIPQAAPELDRDPQHPKQRHDSEVMLARLRDRESLLQTVTQVAQTLLTGANFDTALNTSLRLLGQSLDVHRASFVAHRPAVVAGVEPTWEVTHSWNVPGVPSQLSISRTGPYPGPEFWEAMNAGKHFTISIDESGSDFSSTQVPLAVKTILTVPIRVAGGYRGCVGFDDCHRRRQWADHEIASLHTVAACIGAAISRCETEAMRLAVEQERANEAMELNRVLESVVEASRQLIAAEDFDAALGGWLEALALSVQADGAGIGSFAPDEAGKVAVIKKAWSRSSRDPRPATPIPATKDFNEFAEKLSAGETIVAHRDELCDPASVRFRESVHVFSDVIVPIRGDTQVVGWVTFNWAQRHELTPAHVAALRTAANGVASALKRHEARRALLVEREQRLLAEQAKSAAIAGERQQAAQRRVAELAAANQALGRATAGLVGAVDAATFLCSLQAETTAITGAKTSGIFTYDEDTERLQMFALMSSGVPIDILKDPRMEVWRQEVPLAISRRWIEQLRSRDFATFDNHTAPDQHPWPISRKWHEMMGHRYIITVPLYVGQRMIGTFGQCFPDGYNVTRFDFSMTRVFANHAALALQLTNLAEQARASSNTAAVLDERARLAGQIHDTLAQQFTGALLHLEALSTRASRGYVVTPEDLQTVRKIAAVGLAEARRSALNLRPLELDGGTLADALQHLAERSRVAGLLDCDFSRTGTPCRMMAAQDEALLSIAHEAVNNAIRHGEASRISIQLNSKPTEVEMIIADDGRGFDHSHARQQGRTFGLRSMETRAASIGARCEFASGPRRGTIITVRIPIA